MKFTNILSCAALTAVLISGAVYAADAPASTAIAAAPKAPGRPINYSAIPVALLGTMATLPADEKTKIQGIDDKLKTDTEAARTTGSKEDFRAQSNKLREQANSDIAASMTADQIAAVDMYAPAVELLASSIKGGPGAIASLNITPDQLNKLKAISDDFAAKQKQAQDEMQQKVNDLRSAAKTQASDVLTDEQKAALDTKPAPTRTPRVAK